MNTQGWSHCGRTHNEKDAQFPEHKILSTNNLTTWKSDHLVYKLPSDDEWSKVSNLIGNPVINKYFFNGDIPLLSAEERVDYWVNKMKENNQLFEKYSYLPSSLFWNVYSKDNDYIGFILVEPMGYCGNQLAVPNSDKLEELFMKDKYRNPYANIAIAVAPEKQKKATPQK